MAPSRVPRCAARRPERRGGREQVHGRLHLVLPGKRVDLGQDLADRGAPPAIMVSNEVASAARTVWAFTCTAPRCP